MVDSGQPKNAVFGKYVGEFLGAVTTLGSSRTRSSLFTGGADSRAEFSEDSSTAGLLKSKNKRLFVYAAWRMVATIPPRNFSNLQGPRMFYKSLLALFLSFVISSFLFADQARTWTDSTGRYKVVGTLIEIKDGGVLLRKVGGDEKFVPLEKLSREDRRYAKGEQKKRIEEERQKEIEQLEEETAARREVVFGKRTTAVWPAKVIRIADGDTVTVLNENNEQIRVRLEAIDTPEKAQAFGQKSKDALGALLADREVLILETGKDRYQRTLGFIELLPNKLNDWAIVNAEMIRHGFAWHYKTYNTDVSLSNLETEAREEKRGLWGGSEEPVAPWDWRKQKKAKKN